MRERNGRATLESIAAQAGVSRQTVSNVLNAPHRVRPDTRQRVEQAIAEAGYRPSAAARALRRRRSETVAMRMFPAGDGINGAVMDRFLHALVLAAQERGHRVILFAAGDADAEVAALAELVHRGIADGCVLTDTTLADPRPAELADAGVPFVAFGRPWDDPRATHAWVDIDGAAATALATDALLDAGLGPVAFIGWPRESGVGRDRRSGWARVADAPLLEDARVDRIAEGRDAMVGLMDAGARAAVCASDSLAVGALLAWQDRFGEPGGPLSPVVGFDDTALAHFRRFSSVAQPVEDAARHCIRLLLAQLDKASPPFEPVLLDPQLILRSADGTDTPTLHAQHRQKENR